MFRLFFALGFVLAYSAPAITPPSELVSITVDQKGRTLIHFLPNVFETKTATVIDTDGLATLTMLRRIVAEDLRRRNQRDDAFTGKRSVEGWSQFKPLFGHAFKEAEKTLDGTARSELVKLRKDLESATPSYDVVTSRLQKFLETHAMKRQYQFQIHESGVLKTERKASLKEFSFADPKRFVLRRDIEIADLVKTLRKKFDDSRFTGGKTRSKANDRGPSVTRNEAGHA